MISSLDCGGRLLSLHRPRVMGVLNVTPDSFSDGGRFIGAPAAIEHARAMQAAGAGIIDIGGESTRPGSTGVSVQEELDRVIPVIEALKDRVDLPLSVDTSKPEVMRAAAAAGAGLINDVMALRRPGSLEAARDTALPVCLMHMQGTPASMQDDPVYDDVVTEVRAFLEQRLDVAQRAGIPASRLLVDPGFGFGKRDPHNAQLLAQLPVIGELGFPVLTGLSRKSLVGRVLGRALPDRLAGSIAAAALASWQGAAIVRAHDVAETVDAVNLMEYVRAQGGND
ncbi:dihydropteroate synthase [Spiribacter vilamensis]|uniref:Dihydropteroate synthase n=1 Tax=Spiribacter vilamensis TaxID=531306 RepID=A0A4V2GJ46_9GAMM|nr:dihydropteroate synthase [Spiribacter vilamensis]RZU98875.1 dihydropteroate synthase [Spiribacter vilamensis]